jgi:hypothetical protein
MLTPQIAALLLCAVAVPAAVALYRYLKALNVSTTQCLPKALAWLTANAFSISYCLHAILTALWVAWDPNANIALLVGCCALPVAIGMYFTPPPTNAAPTPSLPTPTTPASTATFPPTAPAATSPVYAEERSDAENSPNEPGHGRAPADPPPPLPSGRTSPGASRERAALRVQGKTSQASTSTATTITFHGHNIQSPVSVGMKDSYPPSGQPPLPLDYLAALSPAPTIPALAPPHEQETAKIMDTTGQKTVEPKNVTFTTPNPISKGRGAAGLGLSTAAPSSKTIIEKETSTTTESNGNVTSAKVMEKKTVIIPPRPFTPLSPADTSTSSPSEYNGLDTVIPLEQCSSAPINNAIAHFANNVPPTPTPFVAMRTMGDNVCQFAWILKSMLLSDSRANLLILIGAAYNIARHLHDASDELLSRIMATDKMTHGNTDNHGNPGQRYFAEKIFTPASLRIELATFLDNYHPFIRGGNKPPTMSDTPMTLFLLGIMLESGDYPVNFQEGTNASNFYSTTGRLPASSAAYYPINGILVDMHCYGLIPKVRYDNFRYRIPPRFPATIVLPAAVLLLLARLKDLSVDNNHFCRQAIGAAAGIPFTSGYEERRAREAAATKLRAPPAPDVVVVDDTLPAPEPGFTFQGRKLAAAKSATIAAAANKATDALEAANLAAAKSASLLTATETAAAEAAIAEGSSTTGVPDTAAADALAQGSINSPERAVRELDGPLPIGVLSPKFAVRAAELAEGRTLLRPGSRAGPRGLNLARAAKEAQPPQAPRASSRLRTGAAAKS